MMEAWIHCDGLQYALPLIGYEPVASSLGVPRCHPRRRIPLDEPAGEFRAANDALALGRELHEHLDRGLAELAGWDVQVVRRGVSRSEIGRSSMPMTEMSRGQAS